VAHDLRAPLRGTSGFAQVLLEEYNAVLDDRGKNYLQRICMASERMGQLIDDLLSLSSLTFEKMRSDQVNLSQIAETLATELQLADPERRVQFVIVPGLEAHGDKNLIRIVLTNLLNNAWKFTSKHATSRIEMGMELTATDRVFFIQDDGAGYDMAYDNKLFGVFKRLHANEEFPGTGIGLAMVQRIVRLHGGRVWAKGEVDRGATFYFTLAPPSGKAEPSGGKA
jgi:light-regulated signal transduction histidine kinase (bacteriophytochrome)